MAAKRPKAGRALYGAGDGDYHSRWKRLLYIDTRVRSKPGPRAKELARECGVSAKTIYRDVAAMRDELGAPIEYDPAQQCFVYSEEGYHLPAANLSERDLFALAVAENALAQYEGTPLGPELRTAFGKMLLALPAQLRTRHELAAQAIHFAGLPPTAVDPQLWAELSSAILARRKLDIVYFSPNQGAPTERRVDPYLLVVRDREWFLVARTQRSGHFAFFYLPRISAFKRTHESYEVDPDFSAERYFEHGFNAMHGEGKPQKVTLRFAPEHAHLAEERAWSPRQRVRKQRDGSALLEFSSNALFEVERQVLRYGGAVEAVGPPDLRAAVARAAQRLGAVHGSGPRRREGSKS